MSRSRQTAEPSTGPPLERTEPVRRTIRPRRSLPGSRAVVGGLLVAAAAVGTFVVATDEGGAPPRYVVAARDIAGGHQIGAGDVALAGADLPASMRSQAFAELDSVEGGVALGPIGAGELIQATDVLDHDAGAVRPELSFPLEKEWAVGGELQPGEHVDLYATYDGDGDPVTRLVVSGAEVRGVDGGSQSGLDSDDRVVLTVAVRNRAEVLAATNAVRGGDVNVVRTTGATDEDGPKEFRADQEPAG